MPPVADSFRTADRTAALAPATKSSAVTSVKLLGPTYVPSTLYVSVFAVSSQVQTVVRTPAADPISAARALCAAVTSQAGSGSTCPVHLQRAHSPR